MECNTLYSWHIIALGGILKARLAPSMYTSHRAILTYFGHSTCDVLPEETLLGRQERSAKDGVSPAKYEHTYTTHEETLRAKKLA